MFHIGSLQSRPNLGHPCFMTAEAPHFKIRLPKDLKDRLEVASEESSRSLTAEIVHRLVKSFDSVETVMLTNRYLELALINREIAAQKRHLEELANSNAPIAGFNDAREALAALEFHKNLIAQHFRELKDAIDPPKSEAKKRELVTAAPKKRTKK